MAYFALEYVLMFPNVRRAPRTEIVICQWAGPLFTVKCIVSRMKEEVAIRAMLCDDLRDGARTVSALRGVLKLINLFLLSAATNMVSFAQ